MFVTPCKEKGLFLINIVKLCLCYANVLRNNSRLFYVAEDLLDLLQAEVGGQHVVEVVRRGVDGGEQQAELVLPGHLDLKDEDGDGVL